MLIKLQCRRRFRLRFRLFKKLPLPEHYRTQSRHRISTVRLHFSKLRRAACADILSPVPDNRSYLIDGSLINLAFRSHHSILGILQAADLTPFRIGIERNNIGTCRI